LSFFRYIQDVIFTACRKATLQLLYMLRQICLFIRHTLVLCQDEGTWRDAVFSIG